ncbi:nitroreductase/quinone reductase family protein [Actinomadura opuntiae]|uniref:nitroreductase/quinone reductase family protein n=1 Tax=Actinomadura sp. OS1-43 TaxID=604315 RepID=UPI00255AB54E|nr:nitroreductase/quinone reductase family protein [Actinomadura sp. OS1-43]MDL4815174.1 nitroreductase/quinone reductase family protein [Actinomadura sp. OS1-43]
MTKAAELHSRITPRLAHGPGAVLARRAHAWVLRRFKGRVAGTLFGAPLLVVSTTGRKSGRVRDATLAYVGHGDGYAVAATNAGSERPPAWWLNLQADPGCQVLVRGRRQAMVARAATPEETGRLWPELIEVYPGFRHYLRIARREMPIVLLEPAS